MGNRQQTALKRKEIQDLTRTTHFDELELNQLHQKFREISMSISPDGLIDKHEFTQALGLQDNLFTDRIFQLFDENSDGSISFNEFIIGLSVFCKKGTLEEKLLFSFNIYDFDGDGNIDRDELYRILRSSLFDNHLNLTEEQMMAVVASTFNEADTDGDGLISFEEYKQMVLRHPQMIKFMTISQAFDVTL
eukprot:gnl/Trimastix_PCT/1270.p1 GENE.gnl/Trimastix_PCT/1270~~gnl/Trimastix_PCT/1270.p1  ORF type:complete len:191 (-),score=61.84 gnl/Trimastix_PCT/1270:97-669(-)